MSDALYDKLSSYSKSDFYPFHMPGHKRNQDISFLSSELDITEIDGFDNLHHPQGLLLDAQKEAAKLYGAEESFFVVNGSTAGILAAISAATKQGGHILMARNSHKAAYHAAYLKELQVSYLFPEQFEEYGLCGGISPQELEKQLCGKWKPKFCTRPENSLPGQKTNEQPEKTDDANDTAAYFQAVFITSPTYDGMVSDIKGLAQVAHKYGLPLIVDEAHGAHFGFRKGQIPESAITQGADVVIQSMHKTLPSMTQTAIVHRKGNRIDRERLCRYLRIFQTSSPSYVLMAGMQACISLLTENGQQLFSSFTGRLDEFYDKMKKLKRLEVFEYKPSMGASVFDFDKSKILIFTKNTNITGKQLYDRLREDYHLQLEMAGKGYALAMTSVMDTEEGFRRLEEALFEIDASVQTVCATDTIMQSVSAQKCTNEKEIPSDVARKYTNGKDTQSNPAKMSTYAPCVRQRICEAQDASYTAKAFISCEGEISAEFVCLYPPGIPVLVPGEEISGELITWLSRCREAGLNIDGMADEAGKMLWVVDK